MRNMAMNGQAMNTHSAYGFSALANTPGTVRPPDTIASAVGDLDRLNERLNGLLGQLHQVSNTIGAPSPLTGATQGKDPEPAGHVYRLNANTSRAHSQMDDIEGMLAAIQRALG